MKKYKVTIVECLSRTIEVDANSKDEAYDKVLTAYGHEDIVLDFMDFDDVEFNVHDEDE
jgi:hypothetical protein